MAQMNIREANKYRALNRWAEAVVQRDLNLLKQIDQTIDALSEDREAMEMLADAIDGDLGRIKDIPKVIDRDGELIAMLERTRDNLGEYHNLLKRKCSVARGAPELRPDDGVVEAYCEAIDSAARLHNAFNALCWEIGEHDVDIENEWRGPFDNVEDMLQALKA